jgi:hypothetical protein
VSALGGNRFSVIATIFERDRLNGEAVSSSTRQKLVVKKRGSAYLVC